MASIGWARRHPKLAELVEIRQRELLDLLEKTESDDPMVFEDKSRGLGQISETVKSNIGRKRRAIVYSAWRHFFQHGVPDPEYSFDWEFAAISD
jgi:hypothetical protein